MRPLIALCMLLTAMTGMVAADVQIPRSGAADPHLRNYTPDPREDMITRRGVAWPEPRFVKGDNGTVTDQLTGLVWLANASAFSTRNWSNALTACSTLASGQMGLTDGSQAGQWRLPNIRELRSLTTVMYVAPCVCNTVGTGQWKENDPFTGIQGGDAEYWSSTTHATQQIYGWSMRFFDGRASFSDKNNAYLVWPVRDGP